VQGVQCPLRHVSAFKQELKQSRFIGLELPSDSSAELKSNRAFTIDTENVYCWHGIVTNKRVRSKSTPLFTSHWQCHKQTNKQTNKRGDDTMINTQNGPYISRLALRDSVMQVGCLIPEKNFSFTTRENPRYYVFF